MTLDYSTQALLTGASDLATSFVLTAGHLAGSALWGELMRIVFATNTLRLIDEGKAFVPNLHQGTVPDRGSETGAAAM